LRRSFENGEALVGTIARDFVSLGRRLVEQLGDHERTQDTGAVIGAVHRSNDNARPARGGH